MPVMPVRYPCGQIKGYRWGNHGKLYLTNEYKASKAKELAARQGRAIKARG